MQHGAEQDERLSWGMKLLRNGELRAAREELKFVYTTAEAEGETSLMAACLCEMAWACFKLGELEEGIECAVSAKWLWRRLENPAELARALSVEAMLLLDLGFIDDAYELSGEAVALARSLDDIAILAFALNARGVALVLCRELDLAVATLTQAIDLADAQRNVAASAFYNLDLGFAFAKLADEADKLSNADEQAQFQSRAIEHSRLALTKAAEAGDIWTLRVAHCNCAELLAKAGDGAGAIAMLDDCAALPDLAGTSLRILFLCTAAIVRHQIGDMEAAERAAREATQLAESSGQIEHQVNSVEILATILEARGDLAGALAQHKHFHRLYVQQSGECARRRAHVEAVRSETERLRARAAELASLAMSDPLTGIANRRSFDSTIATLADQPFAIAIIDIDHFKRVNDRYSHSVGDSVLRAVAQLMVDHLGESGHVARLGGEEFALVLPDMPISSAAAVCEGVRIGIHNMEWASVAPELRVSVSIGVASGDGTTAAELLIHTADERLYEAKAMGRNQVVAEDSAFVPTLRSA